MHAQFDTRTERNRLRSLLGVFFLALAVPAVVLVQQAFKQLELDAFRRQQLLAEEFSQRIDQAIAEAIRSEDARRFTDYAFLVVAGDPEANFLQQSPLAAFPVASAVPGVIGYFQIDSSGALSTPLLPGPDVDAGAYGITAEQQAERLVVERELRAILSGAVTGFRDAGVVGRVRAESPEELTAKRAELIERGVRVSPVIDHGWAQSIYFTDPNGLLLEYAAPTADIHAPHFVRESRFEVSLAGPSPFTDFRAE